LVAFPLKVAFWARAVVGFDLTVVVDATDVEPTVSTAGLVNIFGVDVVELLTVEVELVTFSIGCGGTMKSRILGLKAAEIVVITLVKGVVVADAEDNIGIGIGAVLPMRLAAGDIVVLEAFKMDAEGNIGIGIGAILPIKEAAGEFVVLEALMVTGFTGEIVD
jgi:hypothetical protein